MWRAVDESFKKLGFSIRVLFVSEGTGMWVFSTVFIKSSAFSHMVYLNYLHHVLFQISVIIAMYQGVLHVQFVLCCFQELRVTQSISALKR